MAIQSISLQDTFNTWRQKNNSTAADLGDKATLSALITNNGSAIQAINEIQTDVGNVATLATTATNTVQAINEVKDGSITYAGTKVFSGASATVQGVLNVQGVTNLGAAANIAGNISVNGGKMAVTASSGNVSTQGTLSVQGNVAIATNKFTITASNGNVSAQGITAQSLISGTLATNANQVIANSVNSPSDALANGGGFVLKGTTDKTLIWDNANGNWTSNQSFNLPSGKVYKINNVSVLDNTTLGSTVVTSSLTTVGTIGTGTWQGTVVAPTYGGTGVNNGSKTLTLSTQSVTLAPVSATSAISVTVPNSGTLATLAGTETFTNKTFTDNVTTVANASNGTKKFVFSAQGISASTTRTLYAPNVNGTLVTTGDTGTVTNTMLAGSIANNKLSNSAITINGKSVALGGTQTVTASTTQALTIGTGLSGTSFDGSTATTITNTGVLSVQGIQGLTVNGVGTPQTGVVQIVPPQPNLGTGATPTFAGANLNGTTSIQGVLSASVTAAKGASSNVLSVNNYNATLAGSPRFFVDSDGNTVIAGNLSVQGTTALSGTTLVSVDWSQLTSKPNITVQGILTGPITGSASTSLGNPLAAGTYALNIATTLTNDSVTLGTHTVGNYVQSISAGTGMSVSGSGVEGANVTVTNADKGSDQNIFKTIAIASSQSITAASNTDTVNITSGSGGSAVQGIVIYGNNTSKTVTISHGPTSPLSGSYGTNGISSIQVDPYGHVQSVSTATYLTALTGVQGIQGTANQILANGVAASYRQGLVTLSLPQDIGTGSSPTFTALTAGNVRVSNTANTINTSAGNLVLASAGGTTTLSDNVVVSGNLTVNGTTVTTNSTTVSIADPIFTLGGTSAPTSSDGKDRGIEFRYYDGSAKVGFFGWKNSTGSLTFIPDATNTSEVFSGTKGTIDAYIDWTNVVNAQSLQGTQGIQGTQGAGGTQGTQGRQGIQGTQGQQGISGSNGTQGAQGRQGIQGASGTVGAQGQQGIQGIQGTVGAQGTNGYVGSDGAQGRQGIQGAQGTVGNTGTTGTQGTTGSQGIQGRQGTQGQQGSTGTQGTVGSQGSTGTTGSTGSQGTQGRQGTVGSTGSTGTQGTAGSTGAAGPSNYIAVSGGGGNVVMQSGGTPYSNGGFYADGSGNVTAASYNATSSVRYKTNIVPILSALDKIEALHGVTYDLKDGTKFGEIGLIAEEVEEVLPSVVVKKDGKPEAVDYGRLTAVLIEAVKTLSARLDQLEKINA